MSGKFREALDGATFPALCGRRRAALCTRWDLGSSRARDGQVAAGGSPGIRRAGEGVLWVECVAGKEAG